MFFYKVLVFACYSGFHIRIYNAELRNIFTHVVIYKFRIILCSHTCKRFSLSLGNTQLFKSILYIFRNFVPVSLHIGPGSYIGHDLCHIKSVNRRAPYRNLEAVIYLQRLKSEIKHPFGIMLCNRYLFYDLLCQTFINLEEVFFSLLILEVIESAFHIIKNDAGIS
ncbi:MAG: hypothetical protein BWY61_00939 [Firmicutes bacterium ADurb.Bin354]|nr:MAG: hypothetical protein BWY61_00939 [Firmicutes bacterium ADurb.Bin354]